MNQKIKDIISEQGWNETTINKLMEEFIRDKNLVNDFENHLLEIQENENNFSMD